MSKRTQKLKQHCLFRPWGGMPGAGREAWWQERQEHLAYCARIYQIEQWKARELHGYPNRLARMHRLCVDAALRHRRDGKDRIDKLIKEIDRP